MCACCGVAGTPQGGSAMATWDMWEARRNTRTEQHEKDAGEHEGVEFDSEVRMSQGKKKNLNF